MKCEVKVLWWASVALMCASQCLGQSDAPGSPQPVEDRDASMRDRWNGSTAGDPASWCPSCAVSSLVEEMRRDCGERPSGGQAPAPDVVACAEAVLGRLLQRAQARDRLTLAPGLELRRVAGAGTSEASQPLAHRVARFLSTHALSVSLRDAWGALAAAPASSTARSFFGLFQTGTEAVAASKSSSFMAGFGLGFLAFALKKLLLPVLIGAQIAKSVLIAMFLPSLLGGLGKVLNRGVSTFASASSASGSNGGAGGAGDLQDFEFKDNLDAAETSYPGGTFAYPETPGVLPASAIYKDQSAATSFKPTAAPKVGVGSYYGARPSALGPGVKSPRPYDFKVFHQIPKSSLLLSHYDPFYSPLLSRLDSVFKQLGSESEPCREQLVCEMYSSPARFAPYSNLVSAQLSRELNELRKPSTDNPEILRFFRYMKAAKDGQDGLPCAQLHPGCSASASRPPLLQTFHDINKLVHARRLGRLLPAPPSGDSVSEAQPSDDMADATVPPPTTVVNTANSTAGTELAS